MHIHLFQAPSMKLLAGLYPFVLLFCVVNPKSLNPVSPDSCHINAWVRAPDLDPGQIIPGQVRIKSDGTCDSISEYSLILRFKERAWVKLPKPDIILPQKPDRRVIHRNISKIDKNSIFEGSNFNPYFVDNPLWGRYSEDISDPSLWDVVEEERIAFESRYKLDETITPSLLGSGVTHNFSLLVPTTDYPPTPWNNFVLGTMRNQSNTSERGDEHIYLYTVEIKFDNGTIVEVPAGYTAFKTMGRNEDRKPEVVTANFTQRLSPSNNLNLSLTINITFPHGRILEQGSIYNLTFTLCDRTRLSDGDTHSNYSLALGPPRIAIRTLYHDRWIETLSPRNNFRMSSQVFRGCQISPTFSQSTKSDLCNLRYRRQDDMGDISSWNVSTSKSLQIAPKAFPSFDMHYRLFESQLFISVPVITHSQEIKNQTQIFDEDYYWVPTTATKKGNNRFFMPLKTQFPIIISPNVKPNLPRTHYLSSHARRPLFIDQSTIYGLSQLSVEERDYLAPKSIPIIKRTTDNVVRQRYYERSKSMYYVGDTWQRKVLNGASDLSGRDKNTLLIQVPRK